MTRVIYVVGNDGSGKTTYSTNLRKRLLARGASAQRLHYHQLSVRAAFRSLIEAFSNVSERKLDEARDGRDATPSGPSGGGGTTIASGARASILVVLLFLYQMAMATEMRLRTLFARCDHLIVDRSYIDDLVTIVGSFRLKTPATLIRLSSAMFPQWRIVYTSAGPNIEYARIVDVDLSRTVHLEKSRRYQEMVEILEEAGAPIRRVDTSRPVPAPTDDPKEGWE
jgi:molybdopterin-guanine dinucleotide biosynthesis protein